MKVRLGRLTRGDLLLCHGGTADADVHQNGGRPIVTLKLGDTDDHVVAELDPAHARLLGRELINASDEAELRISLGE